MPAGDLITADYQIELRSTLMGAGTVYRLRGFSGLGEPPVRARDVELFGQDGSVAAPDYRGPRVIIVELAIRGSSTAAAFTALDTLETAWAPSTTDIPLFWQLPGMGKVSVNGRPRGLEVELDDSALFAGVIFCVGEFHALDPTIT